MARQKAYKHLWWCCKLGFIYYIWFNIFILDEPEPCRSLKFPCHLCFHIELLTAWNDKPPLHASPTSKSNEIVLLEISLQSIRPALRSDYTFKRRCLPARLPRLPAAKGTNKNNQNQRERNGKGSSPRWHKRTCRGLSSWEWLAIRNVLKPSALRGFVKRKRSVEKRWWDISRWEVPVISSLIVAPLTRMVRLGAF